MGVVYLLHASDSSFYKIGYTTTSVDTRLKGVQTGCPYPLSITLFRETEPHEEQRLHRLLHRFRRQGEWFEFEDEAQARRLFSRQKRTREQIRADREKALKIRIQHRANVIMTDVFRSMGLGPRVIGKKRFLAPDDSVYQIVARDSIKYGLKPNIWEIARFVQLKMEYFDTPVETRKPFLSEEPYGPFDQTVGPA